MAMELRIASNKRKMWASYVSFATVPISGFVTDVYLPSFPAMAKELQVSESNIQLTLTCFLLSYGISQLFVGSILDSIGRFRPKILGLILVILSNLIIANLTDINWICALRIIQGIAVSMIVIGNRALIMDIHPREKAKQYLSFFTILWSIGPIVAPFLGGYLAEMFHWQANFYFLAIYGFVLLSLESLVGGESIAHKTSFNLQNILKLYQEMLKHKVFMLGILIQGLAYSIVMLFNLIGPFVIENIFNQSSVIIGYCTLILGFSWMIGGFIGKKRMNLPFKESIIKPSLIQISLILLLILSGYLYSSLGIIILFAFLIHICSGVIFTSFITSGMMIFPNNAGIAGGLMGGLMYIITSISSFVILSMGKVHYASGLSFRYLLFSLLLFVTIIWMKNNKKGE